MAKALDATPGVDPSQSPTLTAAATQMGVIMGTAAYMSPEQAAGQIADKRSDIWSFGVVLFEMLTGQRTFTGETVSHVLASVLKTDPNWALVPANTPQPIRRLLRRCLERKLKRRLSDAGEALIHLEEAATTPAKEPSPATAVTPVAQPTGWRQALPLALGISAVVVVITGLAVWSLMRPLTRPPTRFAVTLPSGLANGNALLAFSPEGRTLVYAGPEQLYRRDLGQLGVRAFPNTEGFPDTPFFSPDGQWVGFQGPQGLKKVSLAGGPSVALAETTVRGASWGPDDTIIFGVAGAGLSRVSAAGGEPEPITTLEAGEAGHYQPDILPAGGAVLFTVWSGSLDTAQIAVVLLETGDRQMLVGGTYPRYARTGHIVFARRNSLWAIPFDADRLEVTGAAVPVIEGVRVNEVNGAAQFALAGDGSLMYVPGGAASSDRRLVWVDREGREEQLAAQPQPYTHPRVSPDGTRVALDVQVDNRDVVVYEIARNIVSRLTSDPATDFFPVWTPDGLRLAYGSGRESSGAPNLFWRAADGTGGVDRLTTSPNIQLPQAFSPDGQLLVYLENAPDMGWGIGALSLEGQRTAELLIQTEFEERHPALSPDGQWMAYHSDESGQFEVLVRPFPNVDDGRWQISNSGGRSPVWAPDGRELFYRDLGGRVLGVPVQTDSTFEFGNPAVLFEGQYLQQGHRSYDISPDGLRFLMVKEDGSAPEQIIVIESWFAELQRLVPVD